MEFLSLGWPFNVRGGGGGGISIGGTREWNNVPRE